MCLFDIDRVVKFSRFILYIYITLDNCGLCLLLRGRSECKCGRYCARLFSRASVLAFVIGCAAESDGEKDEEGDDDDKQKEKADEWLRDELHEFVDGHIHDGAQTEGDDQ